jgi:hypothetical protein
MHCNVEGTVSKCLTPAVRTPVDSPSVGTADTFNPAIRGQELSIPTVGCIMGHLIGHVLPKSDFLWVDTNTKKEQLYPSKATRLEGTVSYYLDMSLVPDSQVTQGFVVDNA